MRPQLEYRLIDNVRMDRDGFATTGFCGLDSTFLPTGFIPRSGWALLDTGASQPWYAAAHATQGGSLPATVVSSWQFFNSGIYYSPSSWYAGENWIHHYSPDYAGWLYIGEEWSVYMKSESWTNWAINSPNTLAGQSYRVEIPCGDRSVSPDTWYMDSDGDGYGDPARSVYACLAPSAYVSNGADSDDTDSSVH